MNDERLSGNLNQFKGRMKEFLGRLLHDDFEVIADRHQQLVGMLQARYGLTERGSRDYVCQISHGNPVEWKQEKR